jgi:elongation factor Ts
MVMAEVTATMIKDLRERTGAGMADCKKALQECEADAEKAIDYLRKKGLAKAAKKAGREATEGAVVSYIHAGGRIGVLVEINCETDFVARNEDFVGFTKDVAMQIAAMNPQFVRKEEVDETTVARERAVLIEKAKESGKPEAIAAKMVEGQISKWMKEICLLDQSFVKNPDKTIDQIQQELIAKIGENIKIRRFVRFELGEGLEKKKDDFAAEVAKQAGLS